MIAPYTPYGIPSQKHRRGAALIIAVVILAGLLMLGLPFLFTQSGSLSGTRSYAHDRLAVVGQDSAQNMGIAAAASAMRPRWQDRREPGFHDNWTALFEGLGGNTPNSAIRHINENRIALDTRQNTFAFTENSPAIVGVFIEDESGKLNPNFLDTGAWASLFRAVGISDWEDGSTVPLNPLHGQLAATLARLRYELPEGRITRIEQLLLAVPPTNVPKHRPGLTRTELALLAPHLSVHVRGLGRGGLIDLGTVIDRSSSAGLTRSALDSIAPGDILAYPPISTLAGSGTTIISPNNAGELISYPVSSWSNKRPNTNMSVSIDSPPSVNLHQANEVVRKVLLEVSRQHKPLPANETDTNPLLDRITQLRLESAKNPDEIDSGKKIYDALGQPITGYSLHAPLNLFFEVGRSQVGPSADTDPGARGPYANGDNGQSIEPTTSAPVLESRVTLLRISGGSLDRFPTTGYARLEGRQAESGAPASEIIFYQSDLPVDPETARSDAIFSLRGVKRGLRPDGSAGGTAYAYLAEGLVIVALSPRELPPLGISSSGIVTIDSASTVTDPGGQQVAHEQHRIIAQALPQEDVLEASYTTQAQLHALIAQRHGSLLTSFPKPFPRLTQILPDDSAVNEPQSSPTPTDPDLMTGLRPAILRTLNTETHINRDWQLYFAGDNGTEFKVNKTGTEPSKPLYAPADITPEGLRLDANRILSYPNNKNGFLRDETPEDNRLTAINGRQFALWIRPDEDWSGKSVVLLDMQVPIQNAGLAFTGESDPTSTTDPRGPGDNFVSNRFSFQYDGTNKQLVLVLNPGTIPHTADYGPRIPKAFYGPNALLPIKDTLYPAVSPESLGRGGVHRMASAAKQYLIQHRYYCGDIFRPGHWHHVQVAFTSNQPGGMSIIVDQLIGRDVTRLMSNVSPAPMTQPGDHITVPSLVLKTPLSATPTVKESGAGVLYVGKIALDAWAPVVNGFVTGGEAVQALLPERGVIRIGNEYIAYQSIDDDGNLLDCVRGRRQRTDALGSNNSINWNSSHRLEAHAVGDAVFAGGFAMGNISANWWRGGCSLAQPMPDGDPAHKYQVWSMVAEDTAKGSKQLKIVGGVPGQFPPRGYVLIDGHEHFYDNNGELPGDKTPVVLKNIFYRGTVKIPAENPDDSPKEVETWVAGLRNNVLQDKDPNPLPHIVIPTEIVLISQELTGNPKRERAYASRGMVQLYDARDDANIPNSGRAEWISYTEIRRRTDYPIPPVENTDPDAPEPPIVLGNTLSFLINISDDTDPDEPENNRGGFWFNEKYRNGARGRERTAFAASDLKDYTQEAYQFPAGTRVIPVQTDIDIAYLLESGDVVTIAPTILGAGQQPRQMCVRYSADDAFPEIRDDANQVDWSWNVMNRHFAFTEAIPDDWNPNNKPFHLLCWPCWTPEIDMSPLDTNSSWVKNRFGWMMPWANSYYPDYNPGSGDYRQLFIGALDNRTTTNATGMIATIDAVHAGFQPGWQGNQLTQERILTVNGVAITPGTPWMDANPITEPVVISVDQGVFALLYGIVEIGGEAFAYRRLSDNKEIDNITNNNALLIGRSLLGSTPRVHTGNEIVLHLPLGPVAEVNTGLGTNYQGAVDFSGYFSAPAMLLSSRNGDVHEITTMPNNHTAPWLRGMYNTTPVNWTEKSGSAFSNLAPLAIGWWPRYPSGLPQNTLQVADKQLFGSLLRSRSYAWANFPIQFHNTYFTGKELSQVTLIDNGDNLFNLFALAIPGGSSWNDYQGLAIPVNIGANTKADVDVSAAFITPLFSDSGATSERFENSGIKAVDGADLRVIWTYRDTPTSTQLPASNWLQDVALSGNRAPMIGPVIIRGHAPSEVISVEK